MYHRFDILDITNDNILEDNRMFEQLKALLVEKFLIDEEEISLDAELAADLGINSIEQAELLEACAEQFNIDVDDEGDIPQLVTVGDVVEFLENCNK